jgi:hypothetical protein
MPLRVGKNRNWSSLFVSHCIVIESPCETKREINACFEKGPGTAGCHILSEQCEKGFETKALGVFDTPGPLLALTASEFNCRNRVEA